MTSVTGEMSHSTTYSCRGCQQSHVIHCLWPKRLCPTCRPVRGSHTHTWPFLQPDANFFPSGDQAINMIQCLWAWQVCRAVSVVTSQKRTVVSPEPLASCLYKVYIEGETMNLVCTGLPSIRAELHGNDRFCVTYWDETQKERESVMAAITSLPWIILGKIRYHVTKTFLLQ